MNDSTSSPLISIVMPTFNQAGYLDSAIRSVLSQTYRNWELLIVDNFSSDNTTAVVHHFSDLRIQYYKFANHGVIAAARNYGLERAKGEYIAFLDSDDLWLPNKLSAAVADLDAGYDFVCTNLCVFQAGKLDKSLRGFDPLAVHRDPFNFILTQDNFVSTSTVVARRGVLGTGFDTSQQFITAEDMDLWLRALSAPDVRCKYSQSALTKYRLHSASSSSNLDKHLAATLAVLDKWAKHKNLSPRQLRQRQARVYFYLARKLQQQASLGSVKYFWRSLTKNPVHYKTWLALGLALLPGKLRQSLEVAITKHYLNRLEPRGNPLAR